MKRMIEAKTVPYVLQFTDAEQEVIADRLKSAISAGSGSGYINLINHSSSIFSPLGITIAQKISNAFKAIIEENRPITYCYTGFNATTSQTMNLILLSQSSFDLTDPNNTNLNIQLVSINPDNKNNNIITLKIYIPFVKVAYYNDITKWYNIRLEYSAVEYKAGNITEISSTVSSGKQTKVSLTSEQINVTTTGWYGNGASLSWYNSSSAYGGYFDLKSSKVMINNVDFGNSVVQKEKLYYHFLTLTCGSNTYYLEYPIYNNNLVVDSLQDLTTITHAKNNTKLALGTTYLIYDGSVWKDKDGNLLTAVSDSVTTHY